MMKDEEIGMRRGKERRLVDTLHALKINTTGFGVVSCVCC